MQLCCCFVLYRLCQCAKKQPWLLFMKTLTPLWCAEDTLRGLWLRLSRRQMPQPSSFMKSTTRLAHKCLQPFLLAILSEMLFCVFNLSRALTVRDVITRCTARAQSPLDAILTIFYCNRFWEGREMLSLRAFRSVTRTLSMVSVVSTICCAFYVTKFGVQAIFIYQYCWSCSSCLQQACCTR